MNNLSDTVNYTSVAHTDIPKQTELILNQRVKSCSK